MIARTGLNYPAVGAFAKARMRSATPSRPQSGSLSKRTNATLDGSGNSATSGGTLP